jgi:glutathione S-transferase
MLAPAELRKIHPLGKAPVIGVQGPNDSEPKIIAESAFIIEYLMDYFGKDLIPERYPVGKEGQIGGETEEWMRYKYFMNFAEGSMMLYLVIGLVLGRESQATNSMP